MCTRPDCGRPVAYWGLCDRHYDKLVRVGKLRRHPTAPVADHVETLRSNGWAVADIARASGLCRSELHRIIRRERPTVRRHTADGLLAIPADATPATRVSALGTTRRSQAMARMGWPVTWQSEQCGLHPRTLNSALAQGTVSLQVHQAIKDLYARVAMQHGPSRSAAIRAERKGWAPPLAWDDDIDNPHARPVFGTKNNRERREANAAR